MKMTIIASVVIDVEDYPQGDDALRKVYVGIWNLLPDLKQPPVNATLFGPTGAPMRTINTSTRLITPPGRKVK